MTASAAFALLNLVVLPWWILWIAAPTSRWAVRAASHGGVFVALSLVYGALLVAAIASGAFQGLDLDGLRHAFSTPLGSLVGWSHFAAMDLFVGAWIVREACRLAIAPRLFLVLALLAPPLGLGVFLVERWRRVRTLGQIGDADLA